MLARSFDKLEAFRAELADEGVSAYACKADAGDPESLSAALDGVQANLGAPDVMIYNAVGFQPGAVSILDNAALVGDLQTSVVGALTATQKVLPAMVERNEGTLLFTGGGAGLNPLPTNASLSIGKAALRMLALNLAEELKDTNLRVVTLTISRSIGKNEHFAPERIAEVYWKLHTDKPQRAELVYQ